MAAGSELYADRYGEKAFDFQSSDRQHIAIPTASTSIERGLSDSRYPLQVRQLLPFSCPISLLTGSHINGWRPRPSRHITRRHLNRGRMAPLEKAISIDGVPPSKKQIPFHS